MEHEMLLKPCPFCGSEVRLADYGQPGEFEDWAVHCENCRISMLAPGEEEGCVATKEDAVKAWNRRAMPKTTRILADVLEGAPLLHPCHKLYLNRGEVQWCEKHCGPQQTEPDAECWLKYAEVVADEQ